MPVYNYVCTECGTKFEKKLRLDQIGETPLCPSGHSRVRRVFTPPTIVFKGSGFYSTDHRKKTGTSSEG